MLSMRYEGNNNTIDLINTPNLIINGYAGLDQPTSETITFSNPNKRGTQYQRSSIQDRTISLSFVVYDVENTRYQLMNVFKSGEKGTLYLKNEYREGKIECYFEEMTFDKFSNPTTCTIFLRAPYPYFKGLEVIVKELSNVINMFVLEAYIPEEGIVLGEISSEGTSEILNESDTELGVTIEVSMIGIVTNPIIYNTTTNKFIGVNRLFASGEKLVIKTSIGEKKIYVEKDGVQTNLINRLMKGSSFFQLVRGINKIKSDATENGANMIVYVDYQNEYEAI